MTAIMLQRERRQCFSSIAGNDRYTLPGRPGGKNEDRSKALPGANRDQLCPTGSNCALRQASLLESSIDLQEYVLSLYVPWLHLLERRPAPAYIPVTRCRRMRSTQEVGMA